MEIDFITNYYGADKRPDLIKRLTSSSGESHDTILNFFNEVERAELSAEDIYEYMENLLRYIQEFSQTVDIIQIDEPTAGHPWCMRGWEEVEWAKSEIIQWWEYIYYKDYPDESDDPVEFIITHTHDHSDSDHYHDPSTGETVPLSQDGVEASVDPHTHDEPVI